MTPGAPRHFAWQAWPGFVACDAWGAAPLCVAGVALGDMHLDITWQAWHNLTSTVVLRGRRGTYGTGWRPWAGICRLCRKKMLPDVSIPRLRIVD